MELDDLKQNWKQSNEQTNKQNKNIMELIQQRSIGPMAQLKRSFRKQAVLMVLVTTMLFTSNMHIGVERILSSALFLAYVGLCAGVVIFSWINYRLVSKMQMDGNVRSNFEQQVAILEKRLRWRIVALKCIFVFFIVLLEVAPYFQHYRMLDKWHSLSPFIRFGVYAAFLTIQYFAINAVSERKFGRHIKHLKNMLMEINE